jgi:hypothetical protein
LPSCGGHGLADGQPDSPVAEIGHEVQPAAEGLDVAGDDLEGGDLAVLGWPRPKFRPSRKHAVSGSEGVGLIEI